MVASAIATLISPLASLPDNAVVNYLLKGSAVTSAKKVSMAWVPMTQQVVSVSKNICSFMCDQKLTEELLELGEVGLWGFFFPLFHVFAKGKAFL